MNLPPPPKKRYVITLIISSKSSSIFKKKNNKSIKIKICPVLIIITIKTRINSNQHGGGKKRETEIGERKKKETTTISYTTSLLARKGNLISNTDTLHRSRACLNESLVQMSNTCTPYSAWAGCCRRAAQKIRKRAETENTFAVDTPRDTVRRIADCGPIRCIPRN